MYKVDFNRPQWAHFMGIGGISMSSLAQFLLSKGFKVTGSDTKESKNTERLRAQGAEIALHQGPENIVDGSDFCVNTAAVHPDNPEYAAAVRKGIPILNRAELLGQMMAHYPESFAVSGTHGKTTTTGMMTEILMAAGDDPTVSIGGSLRIHEQLPPYVPEDRDHPEHPGGPSGFLPQHGEHSEVLPPLCGKRRGGRRAGRRERH